MDAPSIQYAHTDDGVSIAYSRFGHGPLLLEMPNLGLAGPTLAAIPSYSAYYELLAQHRTIVSYDARGFGRSAAGQFRHSVCWMMAKGDEMGKLPETLLQLSESFEREITQRSRIVVLLAGPVMLLIVGIFIGGIIIALFLPVLSLSTIVG